MNEMKKIPILLAAIGISTACFAQSEGPVRGTFRTEYGYTNVTWRQGVASVRSTFTTNTPNNITTLKIKDVDGVTHTISTGSNAAMNSFVFICDKGPLYLEKGEVLQVFNTDNSTAKAIFNLTVQD